MRRVYDQEYPSRQDGSPAPSRTDVAAYISDMLGELADMAHGSGRPRLEVRLRLLALEASSGLSEAD